jgi:unsaturated rhamnogalacturonyl hydrolase
MSFSRLLTSILLVGCIASASRAESASPAGRSPMPTRDEIVAVMKRAADYQLAEQAKGKFSNGWIRAACYTGVMALYDATKDTKYLDAATAWSEEANWSPRATPKNDLRFADNQACGQVYAELYFLKPDEQKIAATRKMFDAQIAAPKPGRDEWWWCDSLFMAPPALVRMTKATGDAKYTDFMNTMWWDATDFLMDKDAGLYFRDKRYFKEKTANGKKVFWSRGNGWVMAGTVRVLDDLPEGHPDRQKFVDLHKKMAAVIIALQGKDGLWRPSLLDPQEFPEPETSGTAFFCYALAWGINHGTLDRATYMPHVLGAWNGLVSKVTPEGKLGYVQKVAGAPGKVNPEDTHEYAAGALLLAGNEMIKLTK